MDKKIIDPQSRIVAGNAISKTLSYSLERKYLDGILYNTASEGFNVKVKTGITGSLQAQWIKIDQIGKPLKDNLEECFSSIQKILASFHLPGKIQLLFLVNSTAGEISLYLGIRPLSGDIQNGFAEDIIHFISGVWPGLHCEPVNLDSLDFINNQIIGKSSSRYHSMVSLTGVPSAESQYKTLYPATIDKVIAGMDGKDFSYLVIADSISEQNVDSMLYSCRDLHGQAESFKSFNFSENCGISVNESVTKGETTTKNESETTSHEKKDNGFLVAGVVLAASFFPPVGSIVLPLLELNNGIAQLTGVSLLSGFAPKTNKSKTIGISKSESISATKGTSESQGESLSQNIVNKHIESVGEHLAFHSKRLEAGKAVGCWNVGVYILGETDCDTQMASLQLKSILSGSETVYEQIRVHQLDNVMNIKSLENFVKPKIDVYINDAPLEHPLGDEYRQLTTVMTTKELSYLINFPLRTVPGISVIDTAPEFSLNKLNTAATSDDYIEFGRMLHGGSETELKYSLPIDTLAKHTLLSGINGTGKTNTVHAVLESISKSKRNIPFLVIEPAKTEYVDWAIKYNESNPEKKIKIFIPGCKVYRNRETRKEVEIGKLKLNPFQIVWLNKDQDPNVLTHIDRLKSTFASAFPMYDILPVLMEDLIYTLYQEKTTNWLKAEPEFNHTLPPTLTGMAINVDKVIDKLKYEQRVADNMKACLNTRISSLRRGWKKEMLDALYSTPWEELFDQPCVINLSYVGDDVDKSFFMSLILQFLYEYRSAQAEAGEIDFNSNACRHLTVIEEAHRVMQKCDRPEEPQYKTSMMFSNMLSEIRAYGEGLFLVDQVPTRLIPDAIKNTNTKITHRLVSEDDCRAISESMGISSDQKMIIPKLLVGQCLVSTSLSTEKHWIKVYKRK